LGGLLHPRDEAEGGRTPIIVILQLLRRRIHSTDTTLSLFYDSINQATSLDTRSELPLPSWS
jgi:hypothetical protein